MVKESAIQLILVEMNEVNFEDVRKYVVNAKLPNFAECLKSGQFCETTSEDSYEKLEPWIQWVTAHTGLTLAEHGVFRLGDIVDHDIPQIWELLEDRGFRVAAISPMNAKNRTRNAAFFLPDPWTSTDVTGSKLVEKFSQAVSKVVNDNATSRISFVSGMWLLLGAAAFARPSNYFRYASLVIGSFRKSWFKAMFLDRLLADMLIKLTRSKKPDFVTLFLNAGAHIQHHYLFSSDVYEGKNANPDWYVDNDVDPVLDVYELYDDVLGELRKNFPMSRIMIATGLHQDPYDSLTYYWRLTDHQAFLRKHNLPFEDIEPRMSRDFLVRCRSEADARMSSTGLLNISEYIVIQFIDILFWMSMNCMTMYSES